MLTGVILGVIITLLILAVIFLKGQNSAYAGQINKLAKEQVAADQHLAQLAAQVQRDKQQPIIFNLTEEQVTTIAAKVSGRVQVMMEAATEAALKKMN